MNLALASIIGGVTGGLLVWIALCRIRVTVEVTVIRHEDRTDGTDKTEGTHGAN